MDQSIRTIAIAGALGLGLWVPRGLGAQPKATLATPTAAFADPFTQITSVREVPDGKVLVSDLQDKVVQMVDFGAGTSVKIGRQGQGPMEYQLPSTLFALPEGQTWLFDLLGRRFLPIAPDGSIGTSVSQPSAAGPMMMIGAAPGGSDSQGRLYFQSSPFARGNPNQVSDSVPIHRWDRVSPHFDTVAWIKNDGVSVRSGHGAGRQMNVQIGGQREFEPQEAWGVGPDGAVARVLPSPYQVVWYRTGKGAPGAVVPYTPLKVTAADKRAVIEQRKRMRPVVITLGNGGRSAPPPPNINIPEPEFAETKPPFVGQQSVAVSPDGEVWVLRTRPAEDNRPSYDIFDRQGELVRTVMLNPRSRVAGFGAKSVYVVRTDEDDLQYLERYAR